MFAIKLLLVSSSLSLRLSLANTCCARLDLASSSSLALAASFQRRGEWADRPIYWDSQRDLALYYLPIRLGGLWMVGPHIGEVGLLALLAVLI